MTRVVAQIVYQLDVDELPLKKLEKQQNKGQAARGRSRSNVADASSNRRKTFSQGLLMRTNVGKSHPMLQRSGSTKRERFLSGGSGSTPTTTHRSLTPAAKVTGELQLGDMSNEPLLVDSMVSLISESTRSLVDRQSSTSSQQQLTLNVNSERRSSEPTATADHPLLTKTHSVPAASSNTPSPLPSHSPLVLTGRKSPWLGNESPTGLTHGIVIDQQPSSAFVSSLPGSDFILTNEYADTPVQPHTPSSANENSPSGSRRASDNTCTTPETKRHMTKAFSVDDTRQKMLKGDSNCLLSSPDNFSSDILPDRSGSVKVRRTRGGGRREAIIHEEKPQNIGEGQLLVTA